ncbi:MAG TPA: LptF/LptG family permease [Flavobacterium sp.]|nr:LptF/LptG family permease [Flavobacterium sp.]
MKIIDKYILSSLVKSFLSVFTVLYFIFVLQGVWVYIEELAGKDLDLFTVARFLFYYSPRMISMVLPLSVLLASIMTFGNFAENYEFAALKSAGVSLQRAMRAPIFFIICLSFVSFWFMNDVAPQSEYKFTSLRHEIVQTKPAMAIAPGQFNDLGKINMKVDQKTGDKGEHLENVTIHIKSDVGTVNRTVIRSHEGELESEEETNLLKLHLLNGNYYEDVAAKSYSQQQRMPFAKAHFEKYTIIVDLAQFETQDNNEEINSNAKMMNISQLTKAMDSLGTSLSREINSQTENIAVRTEKPVFQKQTDKTIIAVNTEDELLKADSPQRLSQIYQAAANNAESILFSMQNNINRNEEQLKEINFHEYVLQNKFALSFSCILMFFLGAPLGAIIRKGGIGLPIVFAVIIFITYHFINTFGYKLAQENVLSGWIGAWVGTFVLSPLAVNFTYKATRDRGITSMDNIWYDVKTWFAKQFKNQNTTKK